MYAAAGTLRAVAFDLARMTILGSTRSVVSPVLTTSLGAAEAALASDGTLVYVTAGVGYVVGRTLVWVDRQGHETPIGASPGAYYQPRVSPDGTRVAVCVLDQDLDIWLWDLARPMLTRLTFDPAADRTPMGTLNARLISMATETSFSELAR